MPSEICSRRYVSASGGRATSLTASKKASWGFPPSARPYPKPCGFVSARRRRPSVTGLPHSRGLSAMFPGPCALRKGASQMTQPCVAWTGESKGWSLFRSHRTAYKGKGFKDARSRGKAFYEGGIIPFPTHPPLLHPLPENEPEKSRTLLKRASRIFLSISRP